MKKKIVKISGKILVALTWVMLLFSLATIVLMAINKFVPEFNTTGIILALLGETALPLSILINAEEIATIIFIISMVLFIASIFIIRDVSRVYKQKGNKKFYFASSIVWCAVIFVFFTFNIVPIFQNYQEIQLLLDLSLSLSPYTQWLGSSVVMIKYVVVCTLFIVASLFVFITYIACREKTQRQVIKPINNVPFYSEEFEQKQTEQELVKEEKKEEKQIEEKPKVKKQSLDLLTRIMQLNEMKDTGQISDVEYTKLRQKAIKRYKG